VIENCDSDRVGVESAEQSGLREIEANRLAPGNGNDNRKPDDGIGTVVDGPNSEFGENLSKAVERGLVAQGYT